MNFILLYQNKFFTILLILNAFLLVISITLNLFRIRIIVILKTTFRILIFNNKYFSNI